MNKAVYTVEKINEKTFRIDECKRDNCYLLLGDERALLIDCSIGTGNIRALVSTLTDLPVTVAVTHAHGDHAGAGYQFDEIYIPEEECNRSFKIINARRYRRELIYNTMKKCGITEKNIEGSIFKTKWVPFGEDTVFELGNRTVTVMKTPGHSPGGVVFLDHTMKMMFTGDNVCPVLLMKVYKALTLEEWLPGARKTYALSKTFEPWCGHADGRQSSEQIGELIGFVEKVIEENPTNAKGSEKAYYPEFSTEGCVIYDTAKIHK